MGAPVIAIDGPAASGKGTLAKALARELGYDHLDTGLLYRAVAQKIHQAGFEPDNVAVAGAMARELKVADLSVPGLRGEAMGRRASICSGIAEVRQALLDYQLDFAKNPPSGKGAVLDGRDIGTAVCPGADLKIWMTAAPETRASRRRAEDVSGPSLSEILAAITERDVRETTRAISPLIPACDAKIIDTTSLSAQEALDLALGWSAAISSTPQKSGPRPSR